MSPTCCLKAHIWKVKLISGMVIEGFILATKAAIQLFPLVSKQENQTMIDVTEQAFVSLIYHFSLSCDTDKGGFKGKKMSNSSSLKKRNMLVCWKGCEEIKMWLVMMTAYHQEYRIPWTLTLSRGKGDRPQSGRLRSNKWQICQVPLFSSAFLPSFLSSLSLWEVWRVMTGRKYWAIIGWT